MKIKFLNSPLGALLTGRSAHHLLPCGNQHRIHSQTLDDFFQLQVEAKREGFDLQLVSSYRDFQHQQRIWNRKAKTLVLTDILRWSAIPGTSRHHWGTDIDVFDASRIAHENVQLSTEESLPGGPNFEMFQWLTERIQENKCFGFYRPYALDRGGVAEEPWHLSHAPVASELYSQFSFELFCENLHASDLLLKEELLSSAESLFKNYFQNVDFA